MKKWKKILLMINCIMLCCLLGILYENGLYSRATKDTITAMSKIVASSDDDDDSDDGDSGTEETYKKSDEAKSSTESASDKDNSGDSNDSDSASNDSNEESNPVSSEEADQAEAKRNQMLNAKELTAEYLAELEETKADLQAYIIKVDKQLAELDSSLLELTSRQSEVETQLSTIQQDLDDSKDMLEKQKSSMALRIKYLYENGDGGYLDTIFCSKTLGDMLNRIEYVNQMAKYDKKLISEFQNQTTIVSKREAEKNDKNTELAVIISNQKAERETLENILKEKTSQIEAYDTNITAAKDAISDYEASIQEQEDLITKMETVSEVGNVTIPVEYAGGKFYWPVPGHYTITSSFGYRIHPLTGVRTLHGGVDIDVPVGANVCAGADGVVVISQYSSSAGNYILINHGSGVCTVYMHNSKLLVKGGDSVTRGQVIAKAGSTGWSTAPHCHFGVRVNGTYVDPLPYLTTEDTDSVDSEESTEETEATTEATEATTEATVQSEGDASEASD